MDKTYIK